jgi:hypothetical protein
LRYFNMEQISTWPTLRDSSVTIPLNTRFTELIAIHGSKSLWWFVLCSGRMSLFFPDLYFWQPFHCTFHIAGVKWICLLKPQC